MGELIGHLDADQDRARPEFEGAFATLRPALEPAVDARIGGGR